MKKILFFVLKLGSFILLSYYKILNRGFVSTNNGVLFIKLKLNGSAKFILKNGYIVKSRFLINGKGNVLIFDDNVKIINCHFVIHGNNCILDFRGSRIMKNSKFELLDSNTQIIVKNNTGFNNNRILVAGKGNKIEIGKECIFAENAELWASDTHSIIDIKRNKRINADLPIIIEDSVWICNRVLVMKGVRIGKDSIIASGSIVTKNIEKNVIAAGIPAVVIKEGVKWDINRI